MADRTTDERKKLDTTPVDIKLDKPLRHQRVDLQPGAEITVPEFRAQRLEKDKVAHRTGAKKGGNS
jgi:hypothetical protein